jgi:glycosyltransferase involved in cell wall biosynthesis
MILVISAVFPPEPVVSARMSHDIAKELALERDVVVITPKPTRPYGSYYQTSGMDTGVKRHILKSFTCPRNNFIGRLAESFSFGLATRIYILNEKSKIDLIYANTWPIFAQFFLITTARRFNIPVILHVMDIYPESLAARLPVFAGRLLNLLFLPLDKYILKYSKNVITISPQMKELLVKKRALPESKVLIARNWQDNEAFTNYCSNVSSHKFTFMYLGNISPSAGVDILINSFSKANIPNAILIIAGNGSEKEKCIHLSKQKKCEIFFCDASNEQVPEIQSRADILLLPLRKGIGRTATPSKLPAYMYSSKPIIASVDDDSDTADIINSAKCGWIAPPENIEVLSRMMIRVASLKKEELKIIGENGFHYALSKLSRTITTS